MLNLGWATLAAAMGACSLGAEGLGTARQVVANGLSSWREKADMLLTTLRVRLL